MIELGAGGYESSRDADANICLVQCPKCATFWRRIWCEEERAPDHWEQAWLSAGWDSDKLTPAKFKELQALACKQALGGA